MNDKLAKKKIEEHTNLKFFLIIFLSLLVILGVAWYVNRYSERSSAIAPNYGRSCYFRPTGNTECNANKAFCTEYIVTGPKPGRNCSYIGLKFWSCSNPNDEKCLLPKPTKDKDKPPTAAPPPTGDNYAPKGYIDGTSGSNCSVSGWACDLDSPKTALKVYFSSERRSLGSVVANQSRPDVASECGGQAGHGFYYQFNRTNAGILFSGDDWPIDADAQNINKEGKPAGGTNDLKNSSKFTINCG